MSSPCTSELVATKPDQRLPAEAAAVELQARELFALQERQRLTQPAARLLKIAFATRQQA